MAVKGGTKKRGGAKRGAARASNNTAPQIIEMKGGPSASKLLTETLFMMEDDLRLSKKQAEDFKDSLIAVVQREINAGRPVNLFGLVKIVPRLHTKGERMVNSEFGNPESPKVKKRYPAKATLKGSQGIFLKPVKDALPTIQRMQKRVAEKFKD
jgi:hypothetical protein